MGFNPQSLTTFLVITEPVAPVSQTAINFLAFVGIFVELDEGANAWEI